jgi:hypothetical protein
MRRICLFSVASFALALGAVAATGASSAPLWGTGGGGSLAVNGANGSLVVTGQGVIFGYFDQGSLLVFRYSPDSPNDAISVEGASARSGSGVTIYSGSQVRFLLPAGHYTVEVVGSGIDVSAVGHGTINVSASPTISPATSTTTSTSTSVSTSTSTSVSAPTAAPSFSTGWLALDGGKPTSFAKVAVPASFGDASP